MDEVQRILKANMMRSRQAAPCSLVTTKIVYQNGKKLVVFQDRPPLLGQDGARAWHYKREENRRQRIRENNLV